MNLLLAFSKLWRMLLFTDDPLSSQETRFGKRQVTDSDYANLCIK